MKILRYPLKSHPATAGAFKKGRTPWNKGGKGLLKHSEETRKKMSERMKNNPLNYWLGKKLSQEHRNKLSLVLIGKTGKLARNWKGGITANKHSLHKPEYKEWRSEIFKRDNWKCRISDENCNGKIQAHHILPWAKFPELRYQLNNGITLCRFHHPRKREEEMKLSPYFQELVMDNSI